MKWAGSRDKIFSPSGRGRTFFLTSLFIELIDRGREGIRNNGRLLRRGSGPPTLVSSISERDYEVPTFENRKGWGNLISGCARCGPARRMRTTTQGFTPETFNLMRYTLVLAVM